MHKQMPDKRTIKEISNMKIDDFVTIYDYIKGLEAVNFNLRGLVRESKGSKNLGKIGALLIAIPDPITDVPGIALLILAKIIEKNRGANIQEIYREFNEVLDGLKDVV